MKVGVTLAICLGIVLLGLAVWRWSDIRAERRVMADILAQRSPAVPAYDPALVQDQPAPVQRYFNAMLRPGAPLHRTGHLKMEGELRLGDRPIAFDGTQVLSLDHGFIWAMTAQGGMPLGGSDSDSWTRFWLAGLVPVARSGGTADHRRSAFGRRVIEAVVWSPAALLPGPGVVWAEADGAPTVTVTRGDLSQTVTVTLGPDGRPTRVDMFRWSDQTPDGQFDLVPFGARVKGWIWADGQAVASPIAVAYGDQPPFFTARLTAADFDGRP